MTRPIFIIVLLYLNALSAQAQTLLTDRQIDRYLKNDKLTLNFPDSTIAINIITEPKRIRINENKLYYWYRASEVKSNRGGYDGKLLTGPYKVFYSNLNLKANGQLSNGLRTGTWTTWYLNGEKSSVFHYKKGDLHGKFTRYTETGQVKSTEKYKKGKLKIAKAKLDRKARKALRKAKKEKKKLKKEQKQKNKTDKKEGSDINPQQGTSPSIEPAPKSKWWKFSWLKKNNTKTASPAQTEVKKKQWWKFGWLKKEKSQSTEIKTKKEKGAKKSKKDILNQAN